MAAPDLTLENFGYTQQLRRSLGLPDLLVYGLIFMVPIAPMGIFGSVYQASGGMVALAYLIGMFGMLFTALSYAQMVRAFPMAGSVYNYAGRGLSPSIGFLAGWAILLDYVLVPGLLSLIAAVGMSAAVPAVPVWAWIVIFLLINTMLNLLGIRLTATITKVFLVGELIVLTVFLVMGVRALMVGLGNDFSWDAFFNADTFTVGLLFTAASVAVLSFLGFDAISMLAEENRGGPRQIGWAMGAALGLAGLLFIVQTWVAAMLVPNGAQLISEGDPAGTAFYDAARVAGGPWLATTTAIATALAWGVANSMVAQVATSRLLFAMGRDRQLPGFLARVSIKRAVPTNAIWLTAVVSAGLGLYMASREDGIALLASLINFGAIVSFIVLHIAVFWHYMVRNRDGNRRVLMHLIVPLIGAAILIAIAVHASILAQTVAVAWLGLGLIVLLVLFAVRRRPRLSGLAPAVSTPGDETLVGAGTNAE